MNSPKNVASKTNGTIMLPYLTKSMKRYCTFCFLSNDIHIIPAKAPTGVRYAPIFEPAIVA